MRVKIVSDGGVASGGQTSVLNAETGEKIEGVTFVGWECGAGERPKAFIVVLGCELDVEGDAELRLPASGGTVHIHTSSVSEDDIRAAIKKWKKLKT